jgi:hypothetical protein
MGLCVRQQWFMFPRPFTATKREFLKLHLTVIVYVLCILYSLLFRPTNALCVLTINCIQSVFLHVLMHLHHVRGVIFSISKVTKPIRL